MNFGRGVGERGVGRADKTAYRDQYLHRHTLRAGLSCVRVSLICTEGLAPVAETASAPGAGVTGGLGWMAKTPLI